MAMEKLRMKTYLPFLRIETEKILCFLLVADTKVVLHICPAAVQCIEAFPFLLRMFIVILEGEFMNAALYMRKICGARGK